MSRVVRTALRRRSRGATLIEWLVAAPIVLLIGLAGLQWALIWQARHALNFAVHESVRRASMEHGHAEPIMRGLAAGLQAFWLMPVPALARVRLQTGMSSGWVAWKRLRPTPHVFADFAQPARTQAGNVIAGEREIPNDNLRFRSTAKGAASGVSIQDANRIRLELTYGIPLHVPIVGALIARSLEIFDGCATPVDLQLTLTRLGKPQPAVERAWTCPIYRAPESVGGQPVWRLPTRVRAQGWMHSPLRASAPIDSQVFLIAGTPTHTILTAVQQSGDPLSAPPPVPTTGFGRSIGNKAGTTSDPVDNPVGPNLPAHGSVAGPLRGVLPGSHPGTCQPG